MYNSWVSSDAASPSLSIVSLSPVPTSAKRGVLVLAMSSTCYMSYLPTIPMMLNTSGILKTKFTDKEEMYRRVQDFVNQSIQGEKQQYLNIICSRVFDIILKQKTMTMP